MSENTISVLLIEDNPGDRRLIEASLADVSGAAFEILSVDRLATGLQRLAAGGIDVILLDLGLPDSLGLDSFTSVHTNAPDIPIVVLSGLDHRGVAGEAVRAGAHYYLVKSRLLDERLDHIILHAMDRQRVRGELREQLPEWEVELSEAEARRVELCREIAASGDGALPYPTDPTLFALGPDYKELTVRYVRSVRMNEARPAEDVRQMASRLSRIGAGGHHVVRLHRRCVSDLAPDRTDYTFEEDARMLLIDVLASTVDEYRLVEQPVI